MVEIPIYVDISLIVLGVALIAYGVYLRQKGRKKNKKK